LRRVFAGLASLHQFVAGTGEATVDYRTLLGEGVQLAVDRATRIDTAARAVRLASGRALDYGRVIYAVGSTAAIVFSVPGAAEFAFPIAEFEAARRLRAKLERLPVGISGLDSFRMPTEAARFGSPATAPYAWSQLRRASTAVSPSGGESAGGLDERAEHPRHDVVSVLVSFATVRERPPRATRRPCAGPERWRTAPDGSP
jgi:hypothetical protein